MNDIKKIITDIVERSGLFVEDISMSETGGTIKVICDAENGISSSQLVKVSKKILKDSVYDQNYSELYRLEVSSPGIEAPLILPRHFRKNIGRDIELEHESEDHKSPLKAKIQDVDNDTLVLEMKIKKEITSIRIPMEKVKSAMLRLNW